MAVQYIVATGEGPTDIGHSEAAQGVVSEENFQHGPIYQILLNLVYAQLPDWNQDLDLKRYFVYRKCVKTHAKRVRPAVLPGHKFKEKELLQHLKSAHALVDMTADHSEIQLSNCIFVYFHDCDGYQSSSRNRQSEMVRYIRAGFQRAKADAKGVAAVPNPVSEAWFIGAKVNPQLANQFESNLSGNDNSPNRAPKEKLKELLETDRVTRDDLMRLVEELDWHQLNMDSFNQLKTDLRAAIIEICGSAFE